MIDEDDEKYRGAEWKFGAMVIDRLCLVKNCFLFLNICIFIAQWFFKNYSSHFEGFRLSSVSSYSLLLVPFSCRLRIWWHKWFWSLRTNSTIIPEVNRLLNQRSWPMRKFEKTLNTKLNRLIEFAIQIFNDEVVCVILPNVWISSDAFALGISKWRKKIENTSVNYGKIRNCWLSFTKAKTGTNCRAVAFVVINGTKLQSPGCCLSVWWFSAAFILSLS